MNKWLKKTVNTVSELHAFSDDYVKAVEKELEGTFWSVYDVYINKKYFIVDIIIRNPQDGDWRRICTPDLRHSPAQWKAQVFIVNLETEGFRDYKKFRRTYPFLKGNFKNFGFIWFDQLQHMDELLLEKVVE